MSNALLKTGRLEVLLFAASLLVMSILSLILWWFALKDTERNQARPPCACEAE